MDSQLGFEHFQKGLLRLIERVLSPVSLTEDLKQAFLACPRHLFVHKYRLASETDWSDTAVGEPEFHYDRIYRDEPLVLSGEGTLAYQSSNSQPSYILGLINGLQLIDGLNVLEIGSGSGWLASMVGHIVGPAGRVTGIEIIQHLATRSREDIRAAGITNTNILAANGQHGCLSEAPFDRVIFTAGLSDLPSAFHEQVASSGLLLAPIRTKGHGATTYIFEKRMDCFVSREAADGYFVPLVGSTDGKLQIDPIKVWDVAEFATMLREGLVYTQKSWWGSQEESFIYRSGPFRTFLSITEPASFAFDFSSGENEASDDTFGFGFWDVHSKAALVVRKDRVSCYGASSSSLKTLYMSAWRKWIELGMPPGSAFSLSVFKSGYTEFTTGPRAWVQSRGDSLFIWSLPT